MKSYTIKILLILYMAIFIASCSKDSGLDNSQDNSQDDEDVLGDTSAPDPKGTFDYSQIASHPRLLLKKGEEKLIKEALNTHPSLSRVNDWLVQYCNSLISRSLLKRKQTGKRILEVSRAALKRIFCLSYAYRMTGNYSYFIRAKNEMVNVCQFDDWNPSHFLDVAEMAAAVSIGYDWLYDDLDPETREAIRQAIVSKALKPSLNDRYNWWLDRESNWNQVCNGGLLLAALATYEYNKQLSVDIVERYLKSIKRPLSAYAPDGDFTEGYDYWIYGTGYQVIGLAALKSSLGSYSGLVNTEGFLETGQYYEYMESATEMNFNYSDATSSLYPNPFLFWFSKETGDMSLVWNEKYKLSIDEGLYEDNHDRARFLPLLFIFAKDIDFGEISKPTDKIWVGHGENPVILIRTNWNSDKMNGRYVGIKGGRASNSHGHMDAGSFVFDANGVRWAMDLGLQRYITLESKGVDLWNMNQDSERWQVFRLNNYSHNTLTINGHLHNVDGKATIRKTYKANSKLGGILDMTPVFRQDLEDASREIVLINEDYLQITDKLTTGNKTASVQWTMCTSASASIISSNTIELTKNSKKLLLTVDAPSSSSVTMKIWTNVPPHLYDASNTGTRRVGFITSIGANQESTLKVRLIPQ